MIKYDARIEVNNGIKFYEQDLLFDDFLYSGDIDIDLNIDYANPGFGIALIETEGNSIISNNAIIFKLCSGTIEIIEKDNKGNITNLFSTSASEATCYKKDLRFKISKRNNTYTFTIGNLVIPNIVLPCEYNVFNIGYYSNKDNVINSINIASAIPYGWIVNMEHTQGGYINFIRDGFELIDCKKNAEIEQIEIPLSPGTYYLKYDKEDSNIKPYVFYSNDNRMNDDEKNILNSANVFTINNSDTVSLKFVGTKGKIKNICITTAQDNDYIRTNISKDNLKEIKGSYIKFLLNDISKFEFDGLIKNAPGSTHYSPLDYAIVEFDNKTYGLYDLRISERLYFHYVYENKTLSIYDANNILRWSISLGLSEQLTIFKNINGHITNLKITDNENNEYYYGVHNELIKYVPGLIKSPIVVLDKERTDVSAKPLDLSSSYRVIQKENGPYYRFTNVEREYFKPKRRLILDKTPSIEGGSITLYLISKYSKYDMDKIYNVPDKGKDVIVDTIDEFCDGQYIKVTEEEFRELGIVVYKETGEIIFTDVTLLEKYSLILIDYLKAESYAVNYDYERKSYAVEISTINDKVSVIYDNIEKTIENYEYINEHKYVNSKIIPTENCYIVIGK